MTQNLASSCLLVAWIILTSGIRLFSVTWLSLGADRVTTDDDHYVGLMAGASVGPLSRGCCDSNDVCDICSE